MLMRSCRNILFKVQSHYSSHVMFHTVSAGATDKIDIYACAFVEEANSTEKQSCWKGKAKTVQISITQSIKIQTMNFLSK